MLETYKYTVDFSKAKSHVEIHEIIKGSLDFPDYYAGNYYGLWDCLTDMLGDINYIEVLGLENVKSISSEDYTDILRLLSATKHAYDDAFSDRFFVTIVHGDGTREEIK